jgi:hypothetical protein
MPSKWLRPAASTVLTKKRQRNDFALDGAPHTFHSIQQCKARGLSIDAVTKQTQKQAKQTHPPPGSTTTKRWGVGVTGGDRLQHHSHGPRGSGACRSLEERCKEKANSSYNGGSGSTARGYGGCSKTVTDGAVAVVDQHGRTITAYAPKHQQIQRQLQPAQQYERRLLFPSRLIGKFIGKGGRNSKAFRDRHHLQPMSPGFEAPMSGAGADPNSEDCSVCVLKARNDSDLDEAVARVEAFLSKGRHHPNLHTHVQSPSDPTVDCGTCRNPQPEALFTPSKWERARAGKSKPQCLECDYDTTDPNAVLVLTKRLGREPTLAEVTKREKDLLKAERKSESRRLKALAAWPRRS